MTEFIGGATMMGYAVAALFFLRFWRKTRERLLGAFSASFSLMALVRIVLIAGHIRTEHHHYVYLIRLVAYAIILVAILDKNRSEAGAGERAS